VLKKRKEKKGQDLPKGGPNLSRPRTIKVLKGKKVFAKCSGKGWVNLPPRPGKKDSSKIASAGKRG